MKILGIDPGTTTIGYAICEKKGRDFIIHDYGVIHTQANIPLTQKLLEIGNDIEAMIAAHKPDICSIEKLYFNTNITTGIAVSHARGVILYACVKAGMHIQEYTPLQVKKGLTGSGSAKKMQVQKALMVLLSLQEIPKPDDAADALGLAYMGSLAALHNI